jgi:PAS domain S-box-containing protein
VATLASGLDAEVAELLEVLGRTADGMIAIDPEMRVVGWNRAATDLLGYEAEEVLGRPCYEILGWHDRHGNAVCEASCPACARSSRDELIETREVMGRTKAGTALWLSVSTVVPPARYRRGCQMVHFVREGSLPPMIEELFAERLGAPRITLGGPAGDGGAAASLSRLTERELEVLRLLAEGLDTREIAARLTLSRATVRNHVQHILNKLKVHSRLEAVALALRHLR